MTRFPDELQCEYENINIAYFSQCDPDADFDEKEWNRFFKKTASKKLKRCVNKNRKYLASLPKGVHA